jgi:hypothetical protein
LSSATRHEFLAQVLRPSRRAERVASASGRVPVRFSSWLGSAPTS